MKPEIGGYIELERFVGRHYHEGSIRLNCCRSALLYAMELRRVEAIWVPDFMCDVVPAACAGAGVAVRTYHIGPDLLPDYGSIEASYGDYMLLCDYYGRLQEGDVERALSVFKGRLVIDETQGFFRRPWEGADTLYTCRKYFGVADGGYLHTFDGQCLERPVKRAESWDKMNYLLGRFERTAGEFYSESVSNNNRFDGEPPLGMSLLTENILNAVDYERVKSAREANYTCLDSFLGSSNGLPGSVPEGPFMYPYLVEDAGNFRLRLAQEKIFVPTLWPNVLEDCNPSGWAYKYAGNILPLPVDQRYGEEEMKRVAAAVLRLEREMGK